MLNVFYGAAAPVLAYSVAGPGRENISTKIIKRKTTNTGGNQKNIYKSEEKRRNTEALKPKHKLPGDSMGILLRSSSTESSGDEVENPMKDLVRKKVERQIQKARILKITAVVLLFLLAASILLASVIYDLVRALASCQALLCLTALNYLLLKDFQIYTPP